MGKRVKAGKVKNHTIAHYIFTILWYLVKRVIDVAIWIVVGVAGWYVFSFIRSPFNLVIGFPLLLVGIGLSFNAATSVVLSVFSPQYNRGICPICNPLSRGE